MTTKIVVQYSMLHKWWMNFIYNNKLELPPVIVVDIWKGSLVDVGVSWLTVDYQRFTVGCL